MVALFIFQVKQFKEFFEAATCSKERIMVSCCYVRKRDRHLVVNIQLILLGFAL